MSAIKTIFDFVSAAPDDFHHEAKYKSVLAELVKANSKESLNIDLRSFEHSTIGIGEMNILSNILCDLKFRVDGMDEGFKLVTSSLAKQVSKDIGKGSLTGEREYNESFLASEVIELIPNEVVVLEPTRASTQLTTSKSSYRRIMASLHGLSAAELAGVGVTVANEMVSVNQDLRHMFLKGYLILCSYNLAVSSSRTQVEHNEIEVEAVTKPIPSVRLGSLMTKRIVVDVEHFTAEELWLLIEMCDEYPKKRYEVDTIYSSVMLEAEDAVFFSNGGTLGNATDPGYGSPERLWMNLVSIAIKFNALEDLREVIRDMRGMCYLMQDVAKRTRTTSYYLKYPKSNSLSMALGNLGELKPAIKEFSSYYSTTKSLVADLLLGEMMIMGAFNALEEYGAFGVTGCPTGSPATDVFFDCTLRNRGTKSNIEHESDILSEWRGVKGFECVIRFGGKLKKYMANMAEAIVSGDSSFLRPQLLHSLPFSIFRNTTWATIRGWEAKVFNFQEQASELIWNSVVTKAFTWVMGVSDTIPKIGMNGFGVANVTALSAEEYKFILCASGKYEISMVQHRIEGLLKPRTDEMEMGPRSFYNTAHPGTRCTVVFTTGGLLEMRVDASPLVGAAADTIDPSVAGRSRKQPEYWSHGGSKVPFSSFGRKSEFTKKMDDILGGGKVSGRDEDPIHGRRPPTREERRERRTNRRTRQGVPTPTQGDNEQGRDQSAPPEEPGIREADKGGDKNGGAKDKDQGRTFGKGLDDRARAKEKDDVVIETSLKIPIGPRGNVELGPDGRVKGVDLVSIEGINLRNQRRDPVTWVPGKDLRGYIIPAKGDGTCGIHAIVKDLEIHGFSPPAQSEAARRGIMDLTFSRSWHSNMDLAVVLNAMGFGLILVDTQNHLLGTYGTNGSVHNVCLRYMPDHYDTFLLDAQGPVKLFDMRVVHSDATPDVQIERMLPFLQILDGPMPAKLAEYVKKKGGSSGPASASGGPSEVDPNIDKPRDDPPF